MERLKHLFRLSLLLFCGLAVSCSNDDGDGTFLQEDYPVTFGTVFNNLKSSTGNTWDGGEDVAIRIGSTIKKYTAATDGKLSIASGVAPFYWQSQSETKTVQAWYPYSASAPTSWSVQAGQSGTSYETIATGYAATDALNKLRGYNNTLAIRAYNAQSIDANKVRPVQAVDTWAESNPASATSSGWYLPSAKELTLLCGQDVNNIWSNDSGTGMRDIVNGAINQIGSPATTIQSSLYWSGSVEASNTYGAFIVYFGDGSVNSSVMGSKTNSVRSVLAF